MRQLFNCKNQVWDVGHMHTNTHSFVYAVEEGWGYEALTLEEKKFQYSR